MESFESGEVFSNEKTPLHEPSEEEVTQMISYAKEMKGMPQWKETSLMYSLNENEESGISVSINEHGLMTTLLYRCHNGIARGENCILISSSMWDAISLRSFPNSRFR
jgi:hypothetical protein